MGRAKAERTLEPQAHPERETNRAIWLNTIARAKARAKVKAERALALEAKLEQDKVKTSPGRWLNIIEMAREQVTLEQDKPEQTETS